MTNEHWEIFLYSIVQLIVMTYVFHKVNHAAFMLFKEKVPQKKFVIQFYLNKTGHCPEEANHKIVMKTYTKFGAIRRCKMLLTMMAKKSNLKKEFYQFNQNTNFRIMKRKDSFCFAQNGRILLIGVLVDSDKN